MSSEVSDAVIEDRCGVRGVDSGRHSVSVPSKERDVVPADHIPGHDGVRRKCCELDGRAPGTGGRASLRLLEPLVLMVLASRPTHGYDLRKAAEEITHGAVDADPGSVYRLLRRLEEEGFVESQWAEGDHGPQRRTYSLTHDGLGLLAHWAEYLRQETRVYEAVLSGSEKALGLDKRH